jgi:glyoxylase-like metal-dependent hydrolase (beta-lactamase superfamily II)
MRGSTTDPGPPVAVDSGAMRASWTDVGNVRVAALLDGDADLREPITDHFPDVPSDDLLAERDAMPGVYGDRDTWHLFVRAWLLLHPGGVTLVDTGVGGASAPAAGWFPEPGRLHEALREAGASPDQIDHVVITHVHDDHIGGVVMGDDPPVPAFPRARYLIQRDDLDHQRALAQEEDEDRVIWERLLQPLLDAGVVEVLDGDHVLSDLIELRHAPGHTPGHQVVRVRSAGARLLVAADTFNHPIQLARPDLPSGTDTHPGVAAATRRSTLAFLLSNPGTTVAPTHFDAPFGRVVSGRDGLTRWRRTDG